MSQPSAPPTVPEQLDRRAADTPDGVVLAVDGGGELTFGAWQARSRAVAHALRGAGVARGDRIALTFGRLDWVHYAVAYLGVVSAGATAVHVYAGLDPDDARRQLRECGVGRVVHGDDQAPPLDWSGPAHPLSTLEGSDPGPLDLTLEPSDTCDILYTSGTTGPPKALTVPHGNVNFGRDPKAMGGLLPGGYLLVPQETCTSSAAQCLHVALISTTTSLICDPDEIDRMGELIARYAVGSLGLSPWLVTQFLAARLPERYDLSSVRLVAYASAPLPPAIAQAVVAALPGARIATAMSQSEAVPAVVAGFFDPARPFSVGWPTPGTELRIVSPDGAPVPPGEVGEVWLRHGAPRRRYLDPALDTNVSADGWYLTNDYARQGEDGEVFLFDRGQDLIRTGAGMVSSLEVEGALYEHPGVREAAVVGVPGPSGPQIVAAVVLHRATEPAGTTESAELLGFLAGRLAPEQVPARLVILDAMPRNKKGKIIKADLRRRFGTPANAPAATPAPAPATAPATALADLPRNGRAAARAAGTVDVSAWEETTCVEAPGQARLARATSLAVFTGDLDGSGRTEWLLTYPADSPASFVGVQHFDGRLGGRPGSFVLEMRGTYDAAGAHVSWSVVPGSGTHELRGLTGTGGYENADLTLEYQLA
jgi:acyl-coenzyme A synthetase/AMP-(fatty) acid ligase